MSSYTRGPLTVSVWPEWPFYIDTHDENGGLVFRTSMPMYSTKQKTVGDVLTGAYMGKYTDEAIRTNARALADEVLRANAPELLEALRLLEQAFMSHTRWNGTPPKEVVAARDLIAKATAAA